MTINQKIMIKNPMGLHLRVATQLVTHIKPYKSRIWIQKELEEVDARSILNLLQMGATTGTELHFFMDGDDAAEAMESIRIFFDDLG
jgi:phosphotransferase system HPr (HPr) family protein